MSAEDKKTKKVMTGKLVKALLEFASRDEARKHIVGLIFCGRSVYATDGSSMVKYSDAISVDEPFFVETAPLLGACKVAGKKGLIGIDSCKIDVYRDAEITATFSAKNDLRVMTDLDRLFPSKEIRTCWPMIDPRFLARLETLRDAVDSEAGFVLETLTGHDEAVRYDMSDIFDDKIEVSVVIMPKIRRMVRE